MKRASVLLAQGSEEVECLMVVDLLQRAEVQAILASVSGERVVTGSHGIAIVTDRLTEEMDFSVEDVTLLLGGIPGVSNLVCHVLVAQTLKAQMEQGKELATICAAPSTLGKVGLFANKRPTYYPGWEKGIDGVNGAEWTGAVVEQSEGFTTGRGLGTVTDFGLALITKLCGSETTEKIKRGIQHLDTLYDRV